MKPYLRNRSIPPQWGTPKLWGTTKLSFVVPAVLAALLGTPFPDPRPDETVIFFPTEAWQVDGGRAWKIHIHGWIFETEWRRNLLGPLYDAMDLEEGTQDAAENDRRRSTFIQRAAPFLVDNQSGKKVKIKLGPRIFTMPPSASDGHFEDTVKMDAGEIDALRKGGEVRGHWLPYSAVLPKGDTRVFIGRVRLIDPVGLSVVSDIDDTVKITHVHSREKMLLHTFVLPFEPIAGMPELCNVWSGRSDVVFHFVSSSPWQLYEPLQQLLGPPRFPEGTFHLRRVHVASRSLFNAFEGGEAHKRETLSALFKRYPDRRFVLIGDESERDPEIYCRLARDYPRQVVRILIRDPDRDGTSPRYQKLFDGLSRDTAVVFREPRQLLDLLPPRPTATQPVPGANSVTSRPVATTQQTVFRRS